MIIWRLNIYLVVISAFCGACTEGPKTSNMDNHYTLYKQLKNTVDVDLPDENINSQMVFDKLEKKFKELGNETKPPIDDSSIHRAEKALPCALPDILKELYRWHDGVNNFLPHYNLLSLGEMVETYQFIRDMDKEIGIPEGQGWPKYYLPILEFDKKEHIALDCKSKDRGALFHYFVEDGSPEPRYRGMGHLLAVTLTGYETNAYYIKNGYQDVKLIEERLAFRNHASQKELQAMEDNWALLETPLKQYHGDQFTQMITWAVYRVPEKRMIPVLRGRLLDSDPETVESAVFALGELKAQEALLDLSELLLHPSSKVRNFAGASLSKLDSIDSEITVNRLLALLDDTEDLVKISAIEALGNAKSTVSVQPLLEKLPSSRPGIQQYVIIALGHIGDKRALQALKDMRDNIVGMDLKQPDLGGTRGSDAPPIRLKKILENAINEIEMS